MPEQIVQVSIRANDLDRYVPASWRVSWDSDQFPILDLVQDTETDENVTVTQVVGEDGKTLYSKCYSEGYGPVLGSGTKCPRCGWFH